MTSAVKIASRGMASERTSPWKKERLGTRSAGCGAAGELVWLGESVLMWSVVGCGFPANRRAWYCE